MILLFEYSANFRMFRVFGPIPSWYPFITYRISPNKRSGSYAKYKYGTFILRPICKAKSLSNFVFSCVLEIVKTKYKSKLKIITFSKFFKYCYFNKYSRLSWSNYTKRQNFRPVQVERISRQQNIVTQKLKFILWKVKYTVGKEENAGYQHFLVFPQCFQKSSCIGSLKVVIVW